MTPIPMVIYTAASVRGSLGQAGLAAILIDLETGEERMLQSFNRSMTSQQAEIAAVVMALEALPEPATVQVFSPSEYVVNCGNGHWSRRSNADLWKLFDQAASRHQVFLQCHKDTNTGRARGLARSAQHRQNADGQP